MLRIRTLNPIAAVGLARLPADRFLVGPDVEDPDAILVRSFRMHGMEFGPSLRAVGRAGAGVDNIPVEGLSRRGVPVFNAPGANANAVKELVIAGMIAACRQIGPAWEFARGLEGSDEEVGRAVEAGKKRFAGLELAGRVLGVVGLGAVGRLVGEAGAALGMNVVGHDPALTAAGAARLSSSLRRVGALDDLLRASDFVTLHVPLGDATRHLIDAPRLALLRRDAVLLNFARHGVVDDAAVVAALDAGTLRAYVCDFPTNLVRRHPGVLALPHLGASTCEAEDNCAVMVVEQVRDFLEHGNVRNSVNFPEVVLPRGGDHRFAVANANVPSMLGRIAAALGAAGINIREMVNMSRGELAWTIVDTDHPVPTDMLEGIAAVEGVLSARALPPPPATRPD